MSSIQKPKYFMGLQHREGQSPWAVFASVHVVPARGLDLFHLPSALCTPALNNLHPQKAAPVSPFLARILLKASQSMHILFLQQ